MITLKKLEKELKAGQISRREFIQAASMFGLATAVPSIFSSAHAVPKKGGKIRIGTGHGSTSDSIDPATWTHNFSQLVFGFGISNHLTEALPDGSLGPELAESWDVTPDAKVWTFKLRKDVEFHNGKTLEAVDVIASLMYHAGKDSKSSAKVLVSPIAEIKADGKHVVKITLNSGNADFAYSLNAYSLVILPTDADGKIDPLAGIGCGAYELQSYEPGVRAKLKKFANFWRTDYGHFDEAEILTIADATTRTSALMTGEVDVIDRLEAKTLHLLARNKTIKVLETSGTAHYSIPMRTDIAPFDNKDVRMALKYAVNREALLQNLLRGHGVLGNDHPIGRVNRYFAKDLPQRPYDIDKAKYHLKKAGLSSLKVDLSAADAAFGGAVDAAVLYKEHAAPAGIDINVVREPNDGYWSNVWMKKPWSMCYWGGRPTEDWMFSTAYASNAEWNDTFWKDEKFDQLLVAARSELDDSKRRSMYEEMQSIVSDDGGVVIPVFNNYIFASRVKVMQPEVMSAAWTMDGNRPLERWWLA